MKKAKARDTETENWIIGVIEKHVGADHAISAETLRQTVGLVRPLVGMSELREMIHNLRSDGHLIGSSQHGYFVPATLDEAKTYINEFREPARDILRTATKQRIAAQNKFSGQQRFA